MRGFLHLLRNFDSLSPDPALLQKVARALAPGLR